MQEIERVQEIIARYVKLWVNSEYQQTYLTAHRAGLHVAQYKDAIDCGVPGYIEEKSRIISELVLEDFMKPLNDYPKQEKIQSDIYIVRRWIESIANKIKN